MAVFSFIVLILLSLVGYSSGAVIKAGKTVELKPQIIDLLMVLFIWAGAIYSRLTFSLNKWLLIAIWLVISYILGIILLLFRKSDINKRLADIHTAPIQRNPLKKFWKTWQNFSLRMGSFQSRILLSLFFFIFVTPIGVAIIIFSDPLNIKHRDHNGSASFWLSKKTVNQNMEESRRQF